MTWLILLPLWAAFNLLAYLLAPVLPRFAFNRLGLCDNGNAIRVEPRLPDWLGWLQTDDNSLYGDYGWRTEHCPDWYTDWGMTKWLWRNPAVGFERSVLAAQIKPSMRLRKLGNPEIQDAPHGKGGVCFVMLGWYWNLVVVIPLGSRCFKLDIGWQLKTYAEQPHRIATQPTARYAMSVRLPTFKTD